MGKVAISEPFAAIVVPDGLRWTYRAIIRDARLTHEWALAGEKGGIHIHGWQCEYFSQPGLIEWMGGIECHWAANPPEWMEADKPSHEHCWLLDGPCWHDGTSLGFSENIAPYLPNDGVMQPRHHVRVTDELVSWFRTKLENADA